MSLVRNSVLQSDAVEYVLDQFGTHVQDAFADLSNQMAQMRERKQKLGATQAGCDRCGNWPVGVPGRSDQRAREAVAGTLRPSSGGRVRGLEAP